MSNSFADVCKIMDPMIPFSSLSELHKRHRWINEPPVISLQAILERHNNPQTTTRHFLSYNTFLLPGISISYDLTEALLKVGLTIADALMKLSMSIEEVLAKETGDAINAAKNALISIFKNSAVALTDELGFSHNDLESFAKDVCGWVGSTTGRVVVDILTGGTAEVVRAAFDISKDLTFDMVWKYLDKIGQGIFDVLAKLGIGLIDILNALHLNLVQVFINILIRTGTLFPYPWQPGEKPALEARAVEIGKACANAGYDIMAFSEVWDQPSNLGRDWARNTITSGWNNGQKKLNDVKGIGLRDKNALLDSGLFHISLNTCTVIETNKGITYQKRGEPLYDTDAWASKGALLSRINVGPGTIDLYNTHLISGGDITVVAWLMKHILRMSDSSVDSFANEHYGNDALNGRRLLQVGELVEFISETHNPNNIAIVCGDTNIVAETDDNNTPKHTSAYDSLLNFMSNIQVKQANNVTTSFIDLYEYQRDNFLPANGNILGASHGGEDQGLTRFDGKCDIIPFDPNNPNSGYCNENTPLVQTDAERIDFLFIEQPSSSHSFTLDVTRVRRMPFQQGGLPDGQGFLSDHMGIDVTFIANVLNPVNSAS